MRKRISKIIISFPIAICMLLLLLPIHMTIYAESDTEILNEDNDSVAMSIDYVDKTAFLTSGKWDQTILLSINQSKWDLGLQSLRGDNEEMEDVPAEVVPSGMNAGTLIVIVLLASITVILLYAFVFKRKK